MDIEYEVCQVRIIYIELFPTWILNHMASLVEFLFIQNLVHF
jgi:hypothetical protein